MTRANEQAYPCWRPEGPKLQDGYAEYAAEMIPGLTKREALAMAAMQGLLASDVVVRLSDSVLAANPEINRDEWFAQQAVDFADALLAELEKTP